MSKKNQGGAAFPLAMGWVETDMNSGDQKSVDVRDLSHGMSLRDYFAAKALENLLFQSASPGHYPGVAVAAYKMADAMLAERDK